MIKKKTDKNQKIGTNYKLQETEIEIIHKQKIYQQRVYQTN